MFNATARPIFVAAAVCLILGLVVTSSRAAPGAPSVEATLRALLEDQARDWTAGRLEAFCALYAENAVFLSPKGRTDGRKEILARYDRRYRQQQHEMGALTLEVLDVRLSPDQNQASVALRWALDFKKQKDASGLSLITLRRTGKGAPFRIVHDASM